MHVLLECVFYDHGEYLASLIGIELCSVGIVCDEQNTEMLLLEVAVLNY